MFGSSSKKHQRLATNLRLAINRLKLLEKKKTELAVKARFEISEYLAQHKVDRARIKVEHIVREDYLVEAMEIVEMYCDLLLTRIGMIQASKVLDSSLDESIATIIWITPRLSADIPELKIVSEHLALKYSKPYALQCLSNSNNKVNPKVMQKLSVQAPPKILIDKYLLAIASTYNVEFEITPDEVEDAKDALRNEGCLIDLDLPNIPIKPSQVVMDPTQMHQETPGDDFIQKGPGNGRPPFNPGPGGNCAVLAPKNNPSIGFNYPPPNEKGPPPAMPFNPPAAGFIDQPPSMPSTSNNRISMPPAYSDELNLPDIPTDLQELPSVNLKPTNPGGSSADIDDEDIMRRFQALKNHK